MVKFRLLLGILALLQCAGAYAFEATRGSPRAFSTSGVVIDQNPGDPALGARDAKIVIYEFIDYACPFCRKMAPDVLRLAKDNPDIRIVFKEFPFLGYPSEQAARASIAAFRQGNWGAFHEALMGSVPGSTIDEAIAGAADAAGLDRQSLFRDMDDPETDAIIARNRETAREIGVDGTPAMIFGDVLVIDVVNLKIMEAYVSARRILLNDNGSPKLDYMIMLGERLSRFGIWESLMTWNSPLKEVAKELIKKASRLYPTRSEVYVALANVHKKDFAVAYLDKAIELDPKNAYAFFERAFWRDVDGTIADLEKAIQLKPNCFECYINLAESWGEYGDLDKKESNAIRAFEIVEALGGDVVCNSEVSSSAVTHYLSVQNEVREWMKFFRDRKMYEMEERVLQSTIGLISVFLSQCFEQREYDEEDLKDIAREDYKYNLAHLYTKRAWRWRDRGKNDKFWSDIVTAKSWSNNLICGVNEMLWSLLESDPDLAEQLMMKVDDGHCWRTAGRYYSKLRDEAGVGADGFPVFMYDYEWDGIERDPQKALGYLDLAIERRSTDWFAFLLRGRLLADLGEYDRAVKDYDSALEVDAPSVVREFPWIWLRRCFAQGNNGRFEEAVSDCERASALDDSGNPESIVAQIFLMAPDPRFDPRQALGWAERAVDKDSAHRLILAHALSANGDRDAAIREYEQAIGANPAILDDLRSKLRELGHPDALTSGEYDRETRAALHQCVRRGCRLWEPSP